MTVLRDIYVRFFRGTALGNAARRLWYLDWASLLEAQRHRLTNLRERIGPKAALWRGRMRQRRAEFRELTYRASYVGRYYWQRVRPAYHWLAQSRESSNFTYDLTARNKQYLAETLAVVLCKPASEISAYVDEIDNDEALKKAVAHRVRELGASSGMDETARFGRRLGWYAIARALKPGVVIETGVDKGLGAVVLCAALLRNAQDGRPGRYYGTDIDPGAGSLWIEPYRSVGTILYGDSIASLENLDATIDFFINDSDHSAAYEAREYQAIAGKLSDRAIVIGDNAHVTDELLRFSHSAGRAFLFFREDPADHWYLGAGIGLSFKRDW